MLLSGTAQVPFDQAIRHAEMDTEEPMELEAHNENDNVDKPDGHWFLPLKEIGGGRFQVVDDQSDLDDSVVG